MQAVSRRLGKAVIALKREVCLELVIIHLTEHQKAFGVQILHCRVHEQNVLLVGDRRKSKSLLYEK